MSERTFKFLFGLTVYIIISSAVQTKNKWMVVVLGWLSMGWCTPVQGAVERVPAVWGGGQGHCQALGPQLTASMGLGCFLLPRVFRFLSTGDSGCVGLLLCAHAYVPQDSGVVAGDTCVKSTFLLRNVCFSLQSLGWGLELRWASISPNWMDGSGVCLSALLN